MVNAEKRIPSAICIYAYNTITKNELIFDRT